MLPIHFNVLELVIIAFSSLDDFKNGAALLNHGV
jgi:hypothetical protein